MPTRKRMTPPRPAPVGETSDSCTDAAGVGGDYRYESLKPRDVEEARSTRVLPSTVKLQHSLRSKSAGATSSSSADATEQPGRENRPVGRQVSEDECDALEVRKWGESSELVKKLRKDVSVDSDEAEEAPAAVISNGREILSQG